MAAERTVERYSDMGPSFAAQRVRQLLVDLYKAMEAKSQEHFSEALHRYD